MRDEVTLAIFCVAGLISLFYLGVAIYNMLMETF